MMKLIIKTAGIIILGMLLLLAAGCKNKDTSSMLQVTASGSGDNSVPVKVMKSVKGSISSYIETTTTLEAEKNVDIVARTSGLVTELLVEEGDSVKKGQIVLKIDPREAQASYDIANATFLERKRQWERAQENIKTGTISEESYDQSRYNFEKAKADLQSSKLRLDYTTVRAPFTGVIVERLVDHGAMLSVNQRIFTIVDTDPLLARIHLPERELTKVRKGQSAQLKLEAYPEKVFEAKIRMINPAVEPDSGTFKVTLEVEGNDTLLRPGLFASVYLVTETHDDAILVPKQALLLEAEKDTIFVVDGKFAYSREVKIGFRDDTNLEILEGVEAGQWIVVIGQDGINSGTEVKLFDMDGNEIEMPKEEAEGDEDAFEDDIEDAFE